VQARQLLRQRVHQAAHGAGRNVHRRISKRAAGGQQLAQQQLGFGPVASPQLHQGEGPGVGFGPRFGPQRRRDGGAVGPKNGKFGPRGVILGQLHDLLEQPAARVVVEVFRRQGPRRLAQAGGHVAGQVVG